MIQVNWTQEKKDKTIQLLTTYFQKYGGGESIAQRDNAQIEAIELMCQIADDILLDGEGIIYIQE